jgi:hypothetical protein
LMGFPRCTTKNLAMRHSELAGTLCASAGSTDVPNRLLASSV